MLHNQKSRESKSEKDSTHCFWLWDAGAMCKDQRETSSEEWLPANRHKGRRDLSSTTTRNWILPTLDELGRGFFPEPPAKGLPSWHLNFSLAKSGAEKPAKPTHPSNLQNCEIIHLWFWVATVVAMYYSSNIKIIHYPKTQAFVCLLFGSREGESRCISTCLLNNIGLNYNTFKRLSVFLELTPSLPIPPNSSRFCKK